MPGQVAPMPQDLRCRIVAADRRVQAMETVLAGRKRRLAKERKKKSPRATIKLWESYVSQAKNLLERAYAEQEKLPMLPLED